MAHIVAAQGLVGLGKAQLPRGAGVLDGGQRACAGATVIAGNRDEIRVGLGHARRDSTDSRLRHELHRYQGLRIDLLQVKDQLRQVLDRVDVMVRRR